MDPVRERGFSLVELIVALGLSLLVTATIFDFVGRAVQRFGAEPDIADRQQRLRVAAEALYRDLITASGVLPYRAAGAGPDPPGTFRPDVVTVVSERLDDVAIRSYYLRDDPGIGRSVLMRAEGGGGDAPVVDQMMFLSFEYYGEPPPAPGDPCAIADSGAPLVAIAPGEFTDGPWCADDERVGAYDADVRRIRRVAIDLGTAAGGGDIRVEVTPRNLIGGR